MLLLLVLQPVGEEEARARGNRGQRDQRKIVIAIGVPANGGQVIGDESRRGRRRRKSQQCSQI